MRPSIIKYTEQEYNKLKSDEKRFFRTESGYELLFLKEHGDTIFFIPLLVLSNEKRYTLKPTFRQDNHTVTMHPCLVYRLTNRQEGENKIYKFDEVIVYYGNLLTKKDRGCFSCDHWEEKDIRSFLTIQLAKKKKAHLLSLVNDDDTVKVPLHFTVNDVRNLDEQPSQQSMQ